MSEFDRNKWNGKYAEMDALPAPSEVLVGLADELPKAGKALDLAGGAGRHGIRLAQRGLDVTIADVSQVGLDQAKRFAAEARVEVQTVQQDFDDEPLPAGPWDLIVSICFLDRKLYAQFPGILATGGRLIVIQPTKKNLERHKKPPADFLLEQGELPGLVQGLDHLSYNEGWLADGRHDAVIVAEKSQLIVDIATAFASVEYPGDDHLTIYDKAGRDSDETWQLLRGKTWQEMPLNDFMSGDTPMPDLTAAAFQYYMPAMLIGSFGHVDSISQSLAFFLSPASAKVDGEYGYDATDEFDDRLSRFSQPQREVIIRTLQEFVRRGWEDESGVNATIERLGKPD